MEKYYIKIMDRDEECDMMNQGKKRGIDIECDGYLFVTFKDGEPQSEHMCGISKKNIVDWLEKDTEIVSNVRQASAIAEGWRSAMEIYRQHKAKQHAKKLMSIFRAEDDDDEED